MTLPHAYAASKAALAGAVVVGAAILALEPTAQAALFVAIPATISAIGTLVLGIMAASIKKTGEATHTLTNSAMGAQLEEAVMAAKTYAVQARRLAEVTKEAGDVAAADAADVRVKDKEKIYQAHQIRQAKVDAKA